MGSAARYRSISPGSSHMIDPMRASTGTVQLSSSYDPYDPLAGPPLYAGYRSDAPYLPSYDPRYTVAPRLEAHPVSKQTSPDYGKTPKLRTEYAIRPRQRSSTASAADSHGRLEVPPTSSFSRNSPVILSGYGRSPSPLTDQDGYLLPASSKPHRRHRHSSSFDYTSDTGQHSTARIPRGAYPAYEFSGPRRYPQTGGLRKGEDIDDYDAYSYTNPREQFEKESAAKLRYHRKARKERPLSLTGIDDSHLMARKEPRALGPQSHRGLGKANRDDLRRSIYGHGGNELDLAGVRQRFSPRSITLHQDHDEGYSSHRDDYDDSRLVHREHKRPDRDLRSRDHHGSHGPRKSSNKSSAPSLSSNGLGTAVLASGYSDDLDYDLSRSDRYRSRDLALRDHSRSRRHSRQRVESDSDAYTSDDDLEKYRREPSVRPKTQGSDSSKENDQPQRYRSRSRHHDRRSLERKSDLKKIENGPSKESDAPPKGILKPPRDKFPEEPNPVREGVAPLKDAHKKGIPPGARWTKIDRRLVNPAALEAGQERFEERSEYVIVLRVLSKEEIQNYAVKTQEIRDSRYRDYTRERRRQREEDRRRGRPLDDFSSDDEDDDESPLVIEGPGESRSAQKNSGTKTETARPA